MDKLSVVLGIFILIFSCDAQEKINTKNSEQIQLKFQKSLNEFGLKVRDTSFIKGNTLYYNVVKDSGYYIDETTGHLIRSYLLVKNYEDLKKLDSVNFYEEFNGLRDKTTHHYPKHGIDKIRKKLSANSLFMDLIPYLLKNTDANDIVNMDSRINEIPDFISEKEFTFKGNGFWEFIYDYTLNSCDPKSEVHMNMNEILHASKYPDFPTRPDIFEYIIMESEHFCKEK
ncbi:hypothetical protein [Winogradskyella sp.]|uniref:hypothetical protein n=1 Tax=Winogradskyella sp. TaxID=1883156 RepID=UPI003BABE0A8